MNMPSGLLKLMAILLAAGLSAGCATHYQSRSDGVYYETRYRHHVPVAYVDPLIYPYWSLDYFYFSRHYHPYSVVVHRYDPWYYPYPGWYYGYRTGLDHHYPWYGHGGYYRHYQPWRSGAYFAFGRYGHHRLPRVRQLDSRLEELQTRRSLSIRSQRPDRARTALVPAVSQSLPATSRGALLRSGRIPARTPVRRAESVRPTRSVLQRDRVIDRLRDGPQPRSAELRPAEFGPRVPLERQRSAPLREPARNGTRRPPALNLPPERSTPAPVERRRSPRFDSAPPPARSLPRERSRPASPPPRGRIDAGDSRRERQRERR